MYVIRLWKSSNACGQAQMDTDMHPDNNTKVIAIECKSRQSSKKLIHGNCVSRKLNANIFCWLSSFLLLNDLLICPFFSVCSGPINGRPNGGDSNQDESVHIEAQRIIDHPCFELKSETVCGSTEHIECRWCSHWCIESTKAGKTGGSNIPTLSLP